MAHELLNVLYVQTQGAFLALENDTVKVRLDNETKLRVPLLRLQGIVVFGRVSMTPYLIHRCADDGRSLVWMTRHGRYKGQLAGPVSGNVLLRRAQHEVMSDAMRTAFIARQIVAGKLQNSRIQLLRSARDSKASSTRRDLSNAAAHLASILERLKEIDVLDEIRGAEGEAARIYFSMFQQMVSSRQDDFVFRGRTRRPPRDRVNAVLSFLYALVAAECAAALEEVGLDPQVGYLHALRPGRPALALDLMEEFRSSVADRLTLTLINRRQLTAKHFEETPGNGVFLTEDGRKTVLAAYQTRKETEITHRILQQPVPVGLVPHIQARLLARHIRGDLEHYIPFIYR